MVRSGRSGNSEVITIAYPTVETVGLITWLFQRSYFSRLGIAAGGRGGWVWGREPSWLPGLPGNLGIMPFEVNPLYL